jgi:hypothetical protein
MGIAIDILLIDNNLLIDGEFENAERKIKFEFNKKGNKIPDHFYLYKQSQSNYFLILNKDKKESTFLFGGDDARLKFWSKNQLNGFDSLFSSEYHFTAEGILCDYHKYSDFKWTETENSIAPYRDYSIQDFSEVFHIILVSLLSYFL